MERDGSTVRALVAVLDAAAHQAVTVCVCSDCSNCDADERDCKDELDRVSVHVNNTSYVR